MSNNLDILLSEIGKEFEGQISGNARHYVEVSIARKANTMGFSDLRKKFHDAYVIVPLKHPVKGMKVRIDGRTFVNYGQFKSGIAVPGYVARNSGLPFKTYTPNDSMILNFT